MKKVILALSLLGLAACSYSENRSGSTGQAKRVEQENLKVESRWKPAVGRYAGILKTNRGDQQIELNIIILYKQSETLKNPDGTALLVANPSITITRVNPVKPTLTDFIVSYTPETGALKVAKDGKSTDIDDVNTMIATLKDGHITGTAWSSSEQLGPIDLMLIAKQSDSTENGKEGEYYSRLTAQYRAIEGKYTACVLPIENSNLKKAYTAEMTLSVNFSTDDRGNQIPYLAGFYHRNTDPAGTFDSSLKGAFRPDLKPATLTIQATPKMSTNGYVATLTGTIVGADYKGTFSSNIWGTEGNFFMKRGTELPAECAGAQ